MTGLIVTFSLLCGAAVQAELPLLHTQDFVQHRSGRVLLLHVIRNLPLLSDQRCTQTVAAGHTQVAQADGLPRAGRDAAITSQPELAGTHLARSGLLRGPTR